MPTKEQSRNSISIIFGGVKKKYLTPLLAWGIVYEVTQGKGTKDETEYPFSEGRGGKMEKIVMQGMLYDFYGDLLTEHQKRIYEDAVYNDMSLTELAMTYEISRQAVHDMIKRCDRILNAYEEKLHLVARFAKVKEAVTRIRTLTEDEQIRGLADEILEDL